MSRQEIQQRYREKHRDEINERHRQWEKSNPVARWEHGLKYRHGMSAAAWSAMWDEQNGRCYLCEQPMDGSRPKSVHIDHDQSHCPPRRSCAACRRGLAHNSCNRALSAACDDPSWFRRFADNLEAANAAARQRIDGAPVQEELPVNVVRLERREESA
jgi:hypothetical protein